MKKTHLILTVFVLFYAKVFCQVQIDKAIDLNGSGVNAKITGIKDVSGATDAVSAGVLQKGSLVYALAAGGPNAYTLTLTPALTAYTAGMEIRFMANVANAAGGTTLKVNALTALTIKKDVGTDLDAGDMQQDQLVSVAYDAVHNTFQLLSRTTDLNSGGTVTSVSVTTANGISGTVANATTTPAISLSLGAITPSSVAATGNVTGANLSGTNTGDQTITLTNDVTGSGTGTFATTIAPNAVTNSKSAQMATKTYKGRTSALTGNPEDVPVATVKTDLGLSGTNSGDITLSGQNYLTLSGQALTAGAVDLSGTHATGTLAAGRFPALSGDVSTSAGSLTTTLATVNSNVGTFNNVTVNAKGLVTAASNTSYLTGNQTISFTPNAGGDVTGSSTGTTSLTPTLTIGAGKVTNSMLAGGIDLTNKVTGILPVANGGTGTGSTLAGVVLGGSPMTALASSGASQYLRRNAGNTAYEFAALAASDVPALGGTPAITLGTSNAVGSASTYIKTDATILAFDATAPAALGTAGPGTASVAARRDHVHPAINLTSGSGTTYSGTLPVGNGGTGATSAAAHTFFGNNTGSAAAPGFVGITAADLPGSFSGFANPGATIGLSATNGTNTTAMRSDAAPALSQGIAPTWTATHNFSNATYSALFTGGNVGVGTAVPPQKLSVQGTFSVGDASSNGDRLRLSADGSSAIVNYTNNAPLITQVNGSERMRMSEIGVLSLNNNNTQTYPPYNGGGGGALSWNFTGGAGEVDIWNNVSAGSPRGFSFRQMTASNAQTELMRLEGTGGIFGKFRDMTYHNFNLPSGGYTANSGYVWFPSAGGEGSNDNVTTASLANANYQQSTLMPYSGRLVAVLIWVRYDSNPAEELKGRIALDVNGTVTTSNVGVNLNFGNGGYYLLPTTGYSFSRGDRVVIGLNLVNNAACNNGTCWVEDDDYWITAIWEYNIQD